MKQAVEQATTNNSLSDVLLLQQIIDNKTRHKNLTEKWNDKDSGNVSNERGAKSHFFRNS